MSRRHPSFVVRYGVAVLCGLAAMVIRIPLSRWFDGASPFIAFTPAIALAARVGGIGPGIFVTILGALTGGYFVVGSFERQHFVQTRGIWQILLFLLTGSIISIATAA